MISFYQQGVDQLSTSHMAQGIETVDHYEMCVVIEYSLLSALRLILLGLCVLVNK